MNLRMRVGEDYVEASGHEQAVAWAHRQFCEMVTRRELRRLHGIRGYPAWTRRRSLVKFLRVLRAVDAAKETT